MSTISVDYDVLNQKGSPAWFSDTFANIPTAGYIGRMFISIDTYAFYRDTGTGWDLIGGPGIGTLTGSGATGQVSFFNGTQVLTGNNNLFWDNTNSRLGINTTTPGVPLDIHATGTNAQFNGTGTNNAYLAFQNAGTSKWRIGNTYNGAANSFDIYNNGLASTAISINSTTNNVNFGSTIGNGTYTYTLPSATGTLALTSSIPANIITGTGTRSIYYLPVFSGSSTSIENSIIQQVSSNIGIDNSPSYKLDVSGTLRNTISAYFATTSGSVGIGTASPSYKFEVSNLGAGVTVGDFYVDTANNSVYVGRQSTTSGDNSKFYVRNRVNTLTALSVDPGGNGSVDVVGTFSTTRGANLATSTGSVGIGLTNPAQSLDVNGNIIASSTAKIGFRYSSSDANYYSYLRNAAASGIGPIILAGGFESGGQSNEAIRLVTNANPGERTSLSINNAGTVTINNIGSGAVTATSGVLSATSDMNLKISDGYIDTALDKILKLTPRYFYWKEETGLPTDLRQLGFYAQEVNEAIGEEGANTPRKENDKWGIYDRAIIAMLTKAMQEINEKLVRNNIN